MAEEIKIEDLGYDSFFENNRLKLKWNEYSVARVTVEYRGIYKVKNSNGEFLAKVTGKQMFDATSRVDYPAVGDWVAITELDRERAVIHGILPRKTILKRKHGKKNEIQIIATNIDVAFVVESIGRDYNLNRYERYLVLAEDGGILPIIILNKTDLISKEELDSKLAEIKNRFKDVEIISTSTTSNEGIEILKTRIEKGRTYCFLGSSGVGKSSLINSLLGKNIIKTEDVGIGNDRGKHATTKREMYFLENGGIVIDNPGMREVGMADASAGVDNFYDDISAFSENCKYADCTHTNEPGCGVLTALKSGKLDKDKYSNYISLRKEAEFYEMSDLERREQDRQFGKFLKSAKKEIKKYKS